MSRQGLAQNDQKCQLCAKFGSFWAKKSNFTGESKSFGTNIAGKKHLGTLFALFFGWAWDQMGQTFNFWGGGNQYDTSFVLKTLTGEAPIGRQGRKCAILTQKFGNLWPKFIFLFWNHDFCQQGISLVHPRVTTFPFGPPRKKFRFRARGHFLGITPVLAIFGHSFFRGATTLNFGPISTKLGGTVRAIKKMTQKDNGPGPGRNHGETGVFTFGRKVVFGLKMGLTHSRD